MFASSIWVLMLAFAPVGWHLNKPALVGAKVYVVSSPVRRQGIALEPIEFDRDSTDLTGPARRLLDDTWLLLSRNRALSLIVGTQVSTPGEIRLARSRIARIRRYLVSLRRSHFSGQHLTPELGVGLYAVTARRVLGQVFYPECMGWSGNRPDGKIHMIPLGPTRSLGDLRVPCSGQADPATPPN